jgi:hypothetical protein
MTRIREPSERPGGLGRRWRAAQRRFDLLASGLAGQDPDLLPISPRAGGDDLGSDFAAAAGMLHPDIRRPLRRNSSLIGVSP